MVSTSLASDNKAAFRRLIVDGFQAGDPAVVDELVSAALVEHQFGLAGSGAQAIKNLKQAVVDVHALMPDVRYSVDSMVADGDTVWTRMTARGTDSEGAFGHPATGRRIEIAVIDVARFDNGRLVEHWGVPDRFALLAQLGLLAGLVGRRDQAEG
ncbi:ester cyclase [Amycolatopsis circi]|uniref:ester cyclase n=1 Tax=Amycolatopsis circi TaxID=871959 RepID=UPI000E24473E|nr:ester cyclase [Amycolatopsis circi]